MPLMTKNRAYGDADHGFPLPAPIAVNSWHTSTYRVQASVREAPPIAMDSPPPFSRYHASFRDSADSTTSTILPRSPYIRTTAAAPASRHPFARAPLSSESSNSRSSDHPRIKAPAKASTARGRSESAPQQPRVYPPLPVQTQTLPPIFQKIQTAPQKPLEPPNLFHPRPLYLASRSDPVLPFPLPSPNESSESHLEEATFVIGHRETLSISTARTFTPPPRTEGFSSPLPPLPRFYAGDSSPAYSPSSSSYMASPISRGPFTPQDPVSNQIPAKATRILGLVSIEGADPDAPLGGLKPAFKSGVARSGWGGIGIGVQYSCLSDGSMASASTSTGSLIPSPPVPPLPSHPLTRRTEFEIVSVERGGGAVPAKAKKLLGIPQEPVPSLLPSTRTAHQRSGSLIPIIGGRHPPPRSPTALLYLMEDYDDSEDSSPSYSSHAEADSSSSDASARNRSESFFSAQPFRLPPLDRPLTPPPSLQLAFPSSPTPFSSFFTDFTVSAPASSPDPSPSHLRPFPPNAQGPAYRESSLMPNDDLPSSMKGKNVKGLVLKPSTGQEAGRSRRLLKKARRNEKDIEEEENEDSNYPEETLPLGGAPPVALGRMSVAKPTVNMAQAGGGGARRHVESSNGFTSIPSMILFPNNPPHHDHLEPSSYPLARSLSTRDFPTSPSASSSADHHHHSHHEVAPPLPVAADNGWELVRKPSIISSGTLLQKLDEEDDCATTTEEGGTSTADHSVGTFGGGSGVSFA